MTWTQAVKAMRKGHKVKRQEWLDHAGDLWISLSKVDSRKDGFGINEFINTSPDLKQLAKTLDDILPNNPPAFHIARAMRDTLETDWMIVE
jgi:hypothetical protein